jgi:hypothetical protein
MKSLRFFILAICAAFVSCDKVKDPIVKRDTAVGENFVYNNNYSKSNYKKVLLEDYTGHRCTSCPAATDMIKNQLLPRYGDSLVVIAVHQGNVFAAPTTDFSNDYRTVCGEEWGSNTGFNIIAWPAGVVNRRKFNNLYIQQYTSWPARIPSVRSDPFYMKLDLLTAYDPSKRALNLDIKATFNLPYQDNVKVTVVYLQDGIVGPHDLKSGKKDDYVFDYMLRGDINGTWGSLLTNDPVSAGDTARLAFQNIAIPLELRGVSNGVPVAVDDKNVSIVVFAFDEKSKEVLQVEKIQILPKTSSLSN